MTRWIIPMAALLGGCIVYDTDGKCPGCDPDPYGDNGGDNGPDNGGDNGSDNGGDTGSDNGGDTGSDNGGDNGGDTGNGSSDMKLTLDPDAAVVGTTFIGHLSSDNPEFDWATVSSVTFYGGVAVLATDPDHGELDLAIQIPQDTPPGSADLLIETYDGQAYFQYDALTILPVE